MIMPDIEGKAMCQRPSRDPIIADILVVRMKGSDDLQFSEKTFRAEEIFFLP